MPVRFTQGDIATLLKRLGMTPLRKGSPVYAGIGPDGSFRRCVFHYHSDQTPVATGTATALARALGFAGVQEMKDYLAGQDRKLLAGSSRPSRNR